MKAGRELSQLLEPQAKRTSSTGEEKKAADFMALAQCALLLIHLSPTALV